MPVQVIKATKTQVSNQRGSMVTEKLRTCCYCRVSTDSDAQEVSYEGQIKHFTDYINAHPDMELSGVYADEGISGTGLKNRTQFNKMIADCEAGLHDLVLVKSISRWARNTVISLETIRKLKELGIPIIFQKEGINTMDASGEILITILSSLAQQESDSISKNVRLGIQYLFQQGKPHLNTVNFLGLTKGKDQHELVIVPEEAALVRRIYREFLEGYSPGMIAGRLTADKIKTPAGKDTWYQSTVDSILKNEKYCGDLLMQKWYVADFLNHKIVKNEGALPQYFVEDHHEPIIPKDVFYQVQGEIQRRSLLKYDPGKIRFGSANALQGRLVCGLCGRTLKEYKSPAETTWRCRKRAYTKQSITKEVEPGCPCRIVPEKEVKLAIIKAFNALAWRRDELVRMQGAIWDGEIKRIDEQIENVQEQQRRLGERLDGLIADAQESSGNIDESSVADSGGEAEFLGEELERLELEYTRLVLERAEAANREVQIRILLELVDAMRREAGAKLPLYPSAEGSVDDHSVDEHSRGRVQSGVDDHSEAEEIAACYDYDEFFRRTSYVVDEGMIGDDGKIMSFSNDMIVRYLEKVVVEDWGYEVWFKAGVSVRVQR